MENKFSDDAPEGFDITCELKWIECDYRTPNKSLLQNLDSETEMPLYPKNVVLCQKWRGAFRDVWVRIPIETP